MSDLPPRRALVQWMDWQHGRLFPWTLQRALVEVVQQRGSKVRKVTWTTGAFLRRLDAMKNDDDLRRFVLHSGRVNDVLRIECLFLGMAELIPDMPEAHFSALNNKLAMNPNALHAVRLALEYVD